MTSIVIRIAIIVFRQVPISFPQNPLQSLKLRVVNMMDQEMEKEFPVEDTSLRYFLKIRALLDDGRNPLSPSI